MIFFIVAKRSLASMFMRSICGKHYMILSLDKFSGSMYIFHRKEKYWLT